MVAFRGTSPFDAYDWCTDVDLSWYQIPGAGNGKVHRGFMKALGQQDNGWPIDIEQDDNRLYAYYAIKKKLKQIVEKNKNVK
ncbi:lipase family protein, partial [Vibrio vulnificus]|uniref:lipase family protein n=1 Tax=Vibrio vulnificus TaxID=672 RepID=UPI0034E06D5E